MVNTKKLVKVGMAWMSIIYVICFGGVAIFPGIRHGFMKWALHTEISTGSDVMTFGTFITGLIIWNVIGIVAVWLFAKLWNAIQE